jgi:hypothetical protein
VRVHEALNPSDQAGADLAPTRIKLPSDSRIPATLAIRDAREHERQPWHEPYVSRFLELADPRDRTAWFHFCTGHHVEFLYWEATVQACEAVISATQAGDRPAVEQCLARVATLIRGSAAMLNYCAAFDPARYDPCLRPSMAAERDDFSGDMSRDFLAMMDARGRMATTLGEAGVAQPAGALEELRQAEGFWQTHHTQVVMSLHPGSSLLRDKLARLRRERDAFDPANYIATVVHSEQALAAYDDYFGVTRTDDMKIGDYWTQAVEKLATVHRSFAMDAETRTALMSGDGVLLAIISETLGDPQPDPQPEPQLEPRPEPQPEPEAGR